MVVFEYNNIHTYLPHILLTVVTISKHLNRRIRVRTCQTQMCVCTIGIPYVKVRSGQVIIYLPHSSATYILLGFIYNIVCISYKMSLDGQLGRVR